MPSKRVRKDSERSFGSCGTPNSSGAEPSGTSSSSSGSMDDENENISFKQCCFPQGCPNGESAVADERTMVKVICNFDCCPMSQFMHVDCFNHWEEGILNYLRSHGRARSWSEKQRRQNLWTKKGYDLAYKACMCKCKHGHLRKDLNWEVEPVTSGSSGDAQDISAKKKNRKKHKDLPSLGAAKYTGMTHKSKSKPIPADCKEPRLRHNSTSSAVSVDQGYISASPNATEVSPYMFSPPSTHARSVFSFHGSSCYSNGFLAPSTSPLPEVPDDSNPSLSPQTSPSPASTDMSTSGVFTPPLSPGDVMAPGKNTKMFDMREIQRFLPQPATNRHQACTESDIEAMSQLIDHLRRNGRQSTNARPDTSATPTPCIPYPPNNSTKAFHSATQQIHSQQPVGSTSRALPVPGNRHCLPLSPQLSQSSLFQYHDALSYPPRPEQHRFPSRNLGHPSQNLSKILTSSFRRDGIGTGEHVLRQKDLKEAEKRELNKYILSRMSAEESKPQVITIPNDKYGGNSHARTEIRLMPMRSTTFAKRYNFSAFQSVLPRQHINPYRIKMEGEGYGSDDLRNFILASLSVARCSQMNCVVCGMDMPIYDHFPLVDGTMFLSPECNAKTEKNCFKVKIEGKHEFVHAACMRCLEGLHMIVCRMCDARWEGTHYQLGTLYMYDIFAANPCCQRRLCCKKCGGMVADIRNGLKYYSDYSRQKTCPHCGFTDHHFIHPTTSYQLQGLVYS